MRAVMTKKYLLPWGARMPSNAKATAAAPMPRVPSVSQTVSMILLAFVFVLARRVVAAPRPRQRQVLGCYWLTVSRVYRRTASLQRQGAPLFVCDDRLHGKENRLEPEEAQLHPDVLRLSSPLHEDLRGTAYAPSPRVTDGVSRVCFGGLGRAVPFQGSYPGVWCTHVRPPFIMFSSGNEGCWPRLRPAGAWGRPGARNRASPPVRTPPRQRVRPRMGHTEPYALCRADSGTRVPERSGSPCTLPL